MSNVRFKPREDYLLIKPLPRIASKVIEVVLHEEPNLGIVVAVGPGKRQTNSKGKETGRVLAPAVKIGNVVRYMEWKNLFPEYYEGLERFLIIQEADVAGIEEQANAA